MLKIWKTFVVWMLILSCTSSLFAGLVYIEGLDGELSDDYLAPTLLDLTEGSNVISGELEGGGLDQDFFTINVSSGYEVVELNILYYFSNNSTNSSFIGVQPGDTLSHSPEEIDGGNQNPIPINYLLFSSALVEDTDDPPLLSRLTVGAPLFGVETLAEGSYAFWLNETQEGSEWEIEFVVQQVPEPSTMFLLALASLFCAVRFRR